MKVVLIDESLDRVGGVERVICTLANNLINKHNVEVISEFKTKKEPFNKYDTSIKIKYLINEEHSITNRMKEKNLLYYLARIYEKIKKKILLSRKVKQEMVHIEDEDVLVFGRVFTALDFLPIIEKCDIKPKIIVRDAIHLEYYSPKVQYEIHRYFPKYVNTIIVSSDESINVYKKFFKSSKMNITKIYNPLGIKPCGCGSINNKTIVSIGRMDQQKGYENLIKAFKLISNCFYDWKLEIYGDGNYHKSIENLINELNLEKQVFIMPSTKDVTTVFKLSSIFVLPSRYEGYANILVEAMACSLPCISYNWLMGVEEIITNQYNGIVVPLKNRYNYFNGIDDDEDIINLANKIKELINNKELRNKIAHNATKIIETRNIDFIIKQWLELISQVGENDEKIKRTSKETNTMVKYRAKNI